MFREDLLVKGLQAGFIKEENGTWDQLVPKLVHNNGFRQETVLASILDNLDKCKGFYWAVAFITEDGLAMLKLSLAQLHKAGVKGRILTSNYLGFNQPKVYRELLKLPNVEVRVLSGPFHIKGYGFDFGDYKGFILGSANLTGNALKRNFEWNVSFKGKAKGKFFRELDTSYEELYKQAKVLDAQWVANYEQVYQNYSKVLPGEQGVALGDNMPVNGVLMPNSMQEKALANLALLIKKGEKRGLLISATGTGKTYLAAFHIRNMAPKRMLFLAHREELLQQAKASFAKVLGNMGSKAGLLSGNYKDYDAKYLFATVQTMSKDEVLNSFDRDGFQAIVLDEVHHSGAKSYQKVLAYFKPDFCLGMTATPERRDKFDIYSLFDHNIVYEIRLREALAEDLLCPFHYYGLQDFTVDNELITEQTEFNKLVHEQRLKHLLASVEYYGYSGGKLKGLAFCSTVAEARFMAKEFSAASIPAVALTGQDSPDYRQAVLEELADEKKDLQYIFTVDIFNEGVDIPQLNQIMLLRPTTSPTIFIQQLGRGLRKYTGKTFVTILDFIGNYDNACNIPVALSGEYNYNKDGLRRYLAQGSKFIPGLSTVNFTAVAKEQIFKSLDKVKWDKVQLLWDNYSQLKQKLGKIPSMMDFVKHGNMAPNLYMANKNAYRLTKGACSYYGFVARYDKEFTHYLSEQQERILGYISQKFALGKRKLDLDLLATLAKDKVAYVSGPLSMVNNLLKLCGNDYNTTYKIKENFVGGELATGEILLEPPKGKIISGDELLKDRVYGKLVITKSFQEALTNPVFIDFFKDILAYGQMENKEKYSSLYKNTPFVYGGKYTYEEICALLQWDVNIPSLNIGGYKWDKVTDTFPIFINYHTGTKYERKIDYAHGFKNPEEFTCYSKPRRNLQSPEIKRLLEYQQKPCNVYLFLRKHKDDSQTAKEFYFLGEMLPKKMVECTLPNGTPGVEMNFIMGTKVEQSLYDYIVNL